MKDRIFITKPQYCRLFKEDITDRNVTFKVKIIDTILIPVIHKDSIRVLTSASPSRFSGYKKLNTTYGNEEIETITSITAYLCEVIDACLRNNWNYRINSDKIKELSLITLKPSDLDKEVI